MNIIYRYSDSNFAHAFDFYYLYFVKRINLSWMASMCYYVNFQFTLMKSYQLIPLWWTKFELECPLIMLIILIYFKSKFKVSCKNGNLVHQNSLRRKMSNICNITVAILLFFFSSKYFHYLTILNNVESTFCDDTMMIPSNAI